ncbi:unnamed protein product [Peniophora sp. CBMAI 1063]|nr:unnamed protein product [Peniophora sp. CBMAI 1063]
MPITRARTSSATRPTGAPRSNTSQRLTLARNTLTLVSKCTFLNLPNELICEILALLSAHGLAACIRTCRYLKTIVTKTHRLALGYALARYQLDSTSPPSAIPAATQLMALNARVDNWARLKWRDTTSVPMPDAGAIYEFVGGVYCNARAGPDERRVNGEIRFYQLPDAFGGNPSGNGSGVGNVGKWKVDVSNMVVLDFTVDPGQDLAVLVTIAEEPVAGRRYELHFRTLSSDEAHPLAPVSIRPCAFTPGPQTLESSTTFRILIMGPILLLLVKDVMHPDIVHLSLHNWQAGPDAIYTFPPQLIEDVVFLSATEFLLLVPNGGFEVYTFAQPTPAVPIGAPISLRHFHLPRLKPQHRYWYLTATANPLPGSRPYDRPQYTSSPFAPPASTASTPRASPDECDSESPFVGSPACESSRPATPAESPSEPSHAPNASSAYFHNPHAPPGYVRPPPFSSRTDDGLLAIAIATLSPAPENHMSCFVLFVRIAKLLALARTQPADLPPPAAGTRARKRRTQVKLGASSTIVSGPSLPSTVESTSRVRGRQSSVKDKTPTWKHVAWNEWGPPTTRLFNDLLSSDWQHAVHGFRTAERVLPDDAALRALLRGRPPPPVHPVRHCVRVRDFNPTMFAGQGPGGNLDDGEWVFGTDAAPYRVIRSPSRISAATSETFAEDVESCLPYREAVSEETFAVSDIMMDDTRLLCLKRGSDGRLVGFDVRTF